MPRTVSIGIQDFDKLISNHYFYVDKTAFIGEWFRNGDDITLITRPRRFGKTLTLSMMNRFFSNAYLGKPELFADLSISRDREIMALQGTYPVISLSFANIKEQTCQGFLKQMSVILRGVYRNLSYIAKEGLVSDVNQKYFDLILTEKLDQEGEIIPLSTNMMVNALNRLSEILAEAYQKKVLIFLDEYDTPLQEAYQSGYWDEASSFVRSFFQNTFKTNAWLDRAILTGITRISKESIFSDMNNLETVTVLDNKYADIFGFIQEEVQEILREYALEDRFEELKYWYDGFTFGDRKSIYNPWSITKYLDKKEFEPYWANTSSAGLISHLLQTGGRAVKQQFETLLKGGAISCRVNQDVVFENLGRRPDAVWSLLLATGYLKVLGEDGDLYTLALTNFEIRQTFGVMVENWFSDEEGNYDEMCRALLSGDLEAMNVYMNLMTRSVFGAFDTASKPSEMKKPENFYHGFVLGLVIRLQGRYVIHSNQESGYGRYDIILEPLRKEDPAIIIEFKVFDPQQEKTLEETTKRALRQIERQHYDQVLIDHHIEKERIHNYGFAFCGKQVLIQGA